MIRSIRFLLGLLVVGSVVASAQTPEGPSDRVVLLCDLGRDYANDAHFDDALDVLSLAIVDAPVGVRWAVLNNIGNVYLLQGEVEDARSRYEEALRMNPEAGRVHLNLGLLHLSSGQSALADEHFRKSIELLGGIEYVERIMGLAGGGAPLEGPRGSESVGVSDAMLAAALRRAMDDTSSPDDRTIGPGARGFQGGHLKPYRLAWIRPGT